MVSYVTIDDRVNHLLEKTEPGKCAFCKKQIEGETHWYNSFLLHPVCRKQVLEELVKIRERDVKTIKLGKYNEKRYERDYTAILFERSVNRGESVSFVVQFLVDTVIVKSTTYNSRGYAENAYHQLIGEIHTGYHDNKF